MGQQCQDVTELKQTAKEAKDRCHLEGDRRRAGKDAPYSGIPDWPVELEEFLESFVEHMTTFDVHQAFWIEQKREFATLQTMLVD